MNKLVNLHWEELNHLPDLNSESKGGVYIWGFSLNNRFIPYYVGIAMNIPFRIYEHINSIISGRYQIFHRDSLAHFARFKDAPDNLYAHEGKLFVPNWPYGYNKFLESRDLLQDHIDHMVKNFKFSSAVLNTGEFTLNDLKHIEKICISQIGLEKLINQRSGYSDRFTVQHTGSTEVVSIFSKMEAEHS